MGELGALLLLLAEFGGGKALRGSLCGRLCADVEDEGGAGGAREGFCAVVPAPMVPE